MRLSGSRARRQRRRLGASRRRVTTGGGGVRPAQSPLAPKSGFPTLPDIDGLRIATGNSGIRYKVRDDLMLATLSPGTVIAGVTTRSATRSAAVLDCEAKLAQGSDGGEGAAILVNAGNANAFTGAGGADAVAAIAAAVEEIVGTPAARVFTSSTGVIGEPLDWGRIVERLADLRDGLKPGGFHAAAQAIGTTDTFPKGAGIRVAIGGADVAIAGIAKGSGMIAPDMATMLVYLFTDARIAQADLQAMVSDLNATSFNCITVDGDTSTSDTLLVAATGCAGQPIAPASPEAAAFAAALGAVMTDLAQQVVRDGEGATKFVEVRVTGAADDCDADRVARSIANSPLVKTALAGEDPNWGRIVMAVGKSGARADRDRLSIRFGPHLVAENGWVAPSYVEADGATYMRRDEIVLAVDLGLGGGTATVWTCDLTHRYIAINADYRS